jgi:methionyl-tRNA formyltransferase
MLAETLPALAAGHARREPQDERFATWAARRTPADGEIDWTRPAPDIARLIRAVGRPYPGARSGALTIWAARPSAAGDRHLATPGQIVAHTGRGFTVACGAASALDILEWENADGVAPRLHARLGGARPCAR